MKSSEKNHNFWNLVVINALVCPGIGTWMAGRKIEGFIQAVMALMGEGMSLVFVVALAVSFFKNFEFPPPIDGKFLALGISGVALFLIALGWSILSLKSSFKKKPPTIDPAK